MHSVHALIVDLTLITIYAGITTLIFKKLKQPMVLGYLLAGILAGCLGWDWNSVSKKCSMSAKLP